MNRLKLYINNKQVDIGPDFQISLNYSFTDIERPTAVKNSFSKTVTLLGTKNNNEIFDQYFDIHHRIIDFDPSQRIPFQLFLGSDILQSGYCKLDNITRVNDKWNYSVTLYGGLGDFLYSLSSSTLEDLSTYFNINTVINKETVYNDWLSYVQPGTQICWVPEYGGVYDDFNNNKIQYDTYNTIDLVEDMDQFQVGDFRSYMQRPALYCAPIIEGICEQSGFDVSIDSTFTTRSNPYWNNLVMTLPMLDISEKDQRWVEVSNPVSNIVNASVSRFSSWLVFDYSSGSATRDLSGYEFIEPRMTTTQQLLFKTGSDNNPDDWILRYFMDFYDPSTGRYYQNRNSVVFMSENNAANYTAGEHEHVIPFHHLEVWDSQYKTPVFYNKQTQQYDSIATLELQFDPLPTAELTNVKPVFLAKMFGGTFPYDAIINLSSNTFYYKYANPSNIRSGKTITLEDVTYNGIKQSDFLLSYAKMFGLLFKHDKNTNKISILSRNSFFNQAKIIDWSDKLDISRDLSIKPLTYDSKYYRFGYKDAKSSYLDAYEKDYGSDYGSYIIDTEYGINKDTKDLLDNFIFTNPITSTEYVWKMNFYRDSSTLYYTANTIYDNIQRPSNFSWDGHIRKRENNELQLYFRLNRSSANIDCWLSDDLPYQSYNQEFCYVYPTLDTSNYTKAVSYLPNYVEYIQSGVDGFTEDFSVHFGNPSKTFNGLLENDDDATIYSRFWKAYLNDFYDKDNKVVTCYFYLKPEDMLSFDFKNFIFVDGVIYHVNKIYDYNPIKPSSTKVELIQVKDINSYINGQRYGGEISYYLTATHTSGTFDGNGGFLNPLFSTNSQYAPIMRYNSNPSMLSYSSNTQTIIVSANPTTSDRSGTMTFGIQEDNSVTVSVSITQTGQVIEYYLTPSSASASITWSAQTAYSGFSTNGTIVKSSGSSWLTVENNTIKAAANSNDFSQQVYSAERTGTINVMLSEDNSKTATVSVRQTPNYFIRTYRNPNVNLYSMNVGTSGYVDVDPQLFSNGTITYVGVDENWLSWDPVNNLIEVAANSGTSTRVGIVTFGVSEGSEELEFEIYQPGTSQYYITPTSTTATINFREQNVYQFTTNGSLMIDPTYSSTDASWLDLETNIAGYTFVTADENGLDYTLPVMSSQRTGTLHLTLVEDSNIGASITVIQTPTYYIRSGVNNRTGATYTYAPDSSGFLTFDPDLYTNTQGTVHYFVQNDASNWLSYDPDDELIYAQPNTTGVERQGYVGFWIDESNDEQDFIIKQKGADYFRITNLSTQDSSITFTNANGNTGQNMDITFRRSGTSTWVTEQHNGSFTLSTTIPANGGYIEFNNANINYTSAGGDPLHYWNINVNRDFGLSGNFNTFCKVTSGSSTDWGCKRLFSSNSHLITAAGLKIKTTKNWPSTFNKMFNNCPNLVDGPILLDTTLSTNDYREMFLNCTSLRSLTSYATNISASYCLYNWLSGVGSNGVLTVPSSMVNQYPIGDSGLPSTWEYGVIS